MFTKRQVCNAKLARDLYRKIGWPGEDAFEDILRTNKIHNCLVTVDDACCAVAIYGPDIPKLKGTTTAGPPVAHVPDLDGSPTSNSVTHQPCYSCYRSCLREQNSFPDNNIQEHWLAHHCTSSESTKGNHIERIKLSNNNLQKPWSTCQLHTWWQWVCMLRDDIGSIHLEIEALNTHVPEIERSNWTIKQHAQTLVHGLTYTRLSILFVKHLMVHVVHYLNIFPWKYGVSTELSPETIMTGFPPPD